MRLFIAINFNRKTKEKFTKIQNRLIKSASSIRPTPIDNIHLTLIFLGEVEEKNLYKIKMAMDKITFLPMELVFDHVGNFHRKEGDIIWIGIKENKNLITIQKRLYDNLSDLGFQLDKRTFSPHLTVGRKTRLPKNFNINSLLKSSFSTNINQLNLIKSEYIKGKVVYSEIYSIK